MCAHERHDSATGAAARVRSYRLRRVRGAGGTPGGVGQFVLGLILPAAGIYLLTQQVSVHQEFRPWRGFGWYGRVTGPGAFGPSLIPFLLGTGILFFNGRSLIGWALLGLGVVAILAGILMNLHLYFRPTSLFNTLLMLGMFAAGVGLLFRGMRPRPGSLF